MRPNWIADATLLNDFRLCPEKCRFRHHLGLVRPGYEEATGSGTAWHAAMEAWFANDRTDPAGPTHENGLGGYDAALTALRAAWGDEPEPMFDGQAPFRKRPLELFERMLALYCEKFPREDDPFEVVGNEEYVQGKIYETAGAKLDIMNDRVIFDESALAFEYCGIRDRKIRFSDGSEYIVDTKSTSARLDKKYFEAFELSQAMLGYCALELVNGRKCNGFMIDAAHVDQYWQKMTKTKGLQIYGGKSENCEFVRYGPIKVADWQLSRWARDTERAIRQLEQALKDDGPWERREQGCFKWNKACEYWYRPGTDLPGICRSPEEMHEGLAAEYETNYWSPKERANG